MGFSLLTAAYSGVAAAAVVLLAMGTPAERSASLQARLVAEKPATSVYALAFAKQQAADFAAVGPRAATAVAEADGIKLRSVGFDFPTSDRVFPGGSIGDVVLNNCTACHSPGMVLNQPALTKAEWNGEVIKMIHTYKAPIADENVPAIVAYLAEMKVSP